MMKMNYDKNIRLALSLGFEEIFDKNAYMGKFYIKDGKIWIHDIEALKAKLHIHEDEELRHLNYDVESYYKYVDYTNEMVDAKIEVTARIEVIKAAIQSSNSVFSGRYDFLDDKKILEGMVGLAKEGFDEETLYAYAHEMTKR